MPEGWTVETLKAHYDQRFKDMADAVATALAAQKESKTVFLAIVALAVSITLAAVAGVASLIYFLIQRPTP